MVVRALIIAIQDYDKVKEGAVAKSLPGTLKAGLDFRDWLLSKWKTEGRESSDTQVIFCAEPQQSYGSGAAREDILKSVLKLKEEGQGATAEFYFFFSGHGFSFDDRQGTRADIIMTSDFVDRNLSGACCLNLEQMISWFRIHLGPGRHYYFVDACRNKLDASQIQFGPFLPWDPQASGEASTFVLQSTVDGAVAAVGGPFPAALLAGLRGKGKAKVWDSQVDDAMFVRYDSLRGHLKASLAGQQIFSRVRGTDGESEGILATLRPIPMSDCTIEIENASSPLAGQLFYTRGRSPVAQQKTLGSASTVLSLEPDRYSVSVRLDDAAVEPANPILVDLYDDQKLLFTRISSRPPAGPSSETLNRALEANVDVVVPAGTALELRNTDTGGTISLQQSGRIDLAQGQYAAVLRDTYGGVIKRQEIVVEPAAGVFLNLTEWQSSAPHLAIADRLPQVEGAPDFSESLGGPVRDPDLNVWIALLGGGRILGSTGRYSKLSRFPLHVFSEERSSASPTYVLAGFENPMTKLEVGLSQDARVSWRVARQPEGMPGILEAYFATKQGGHLVSFRTDGGVPHTVASLASQNRATLITLTLDENGDPCVTQYLLPLGHLVHHLPGMVRERIETRGPALKDVRLVAQAYRAFRSRRSLLSDVPQSLLTDLLYIKWIDPIACALAAYECIRRGARQDLGVAVENMKRFFPDLPDTTALAKLSGEKVDRPRGVPLFLDGLRAFPEFAELLPLPPTHLDFTSPWTAWRAAVKEGGRIRLKLGRARRRPRPMRA